MESIPENIDIVIEESPSVSNKTEGHHHHDNKNFSISDLESLQDAHIDNELLENHFLRNQQDENG